MNGIFTVYILAKKRREHGLETWILFLDLVKAFDRVPLELLWSVMLRKGVPPKIVTLLKALHATVKVKFEIDGVERTLMQIIGVKQGDVLGPDLFIFLIAAIMESWRATHDYDLTTFRTARDFEMTGRRKARRLPSRVHVASTRTIRPCLSAAAATSRSRCRRCARTSATGVWRCTQARTTTLVT